MRALRSGSITHGNEMGFQDFADLFKIFRSLILNSKYFRSTIIFTASGFAKISEISSKHILSV